MSKKNFLDHVNDKQKKPEEKESFQKETFESVKKNTKLPVLIVSLMTVFLIMALVLLNQKIEVIDLTNLTIEEASTWGNEVDVTISSMAIYSNIEEGRVISQAVSAGEKIKSNTILKVEISSGKDPYESLEVPSFDSTWSRSSVLQWLEEKDINNYTFVEEVNDNVDEDFLIRYRLIGATEESFNRSSEIEFVVTQILDTSSIEIPDFMNSNLTIVDMWATTEAIEFEYVYEYSSLYEEDKIFYQSVLAGQNMNRGEVLQLKVSKGIDYEPVEMIGLINMSLSNAEAWLKNNHIPYEKSFVYSSIYNEYTIMDQSVYEGTTVENEVVKIKISLGEGTRVDDFSKLSYAEASYIASQHNNIEVSEAYSTIDEGRLIEQSIAMNAYMDEDDFLQVTYSKGNTVQVPDFRNQTVYDLETWKATQNDQGASISITVNEVESNDLASGLIIRQNIYNGKMVVDGEITIDISSGFSIPDFKTMTKEEAITFGDLSLMHVIIKEEYTEETELGDFVSQSLTVGQKADGQSQVEVVYSLGDSLAVPSYINQPIAELEAWVMAQNSAGANFELNVFEKFDYTIPYGTIMSQSIIIKYAPIGSTFEVLISKGEPFTVPDFTNYLQSSIESICSANDIAVVFEIIPSDSVYSGRVISQYPEALEMMSKDEFIHIQIAE